MGVEGKCRSGVFAVVIVRLGSPSYGPRSRGNCRCACCQSNTAARSPADATTYNGYRVDKMLESLEWGLEGVISCLVATS